MTVADARRAVPEAGDLRRRARAGKLRRSMTATLSLLLERALYLAVVGGVVVEAVRDGLRRIDEGGLALASPGTPVIRLTSAAVAVLCLPLPPWLAAPAPGVSVLAALISAAGAVAVTYRMATRPPMDYGGSVVDFGVFGPTPVGLIVQLLRGPALLAVLALIQMALAGCPPPL